MFCVGFNGSLGNCLNRARSEENSSKGGVRSPPVGHFLHQPSEDKLTISLITFSGVAQGNQVEKRFIANCIFL